MHESVKKTKCLDMLNVQDRLLFHLYYPDQFGVKFSSLIPEFKSGHRKH